jgi:lipopolysaccharide export system permease protein
MRLSFTLSRYLTFQFLLYAGMVLCVGTLLGFLIDMVELMRRGTSHQGIESLALVKLALFKLPQMIQLVMPFAMLIGSIVFLAKLSKSHELIVMRSAGVSVWQFLLPAAGGAFAIGLFTVLVFNPFAASLLSRYEQEEGKLLEGRASLLAISESGLWLREREVSGERVRAEVILHALRATQPDMRLTDVILFVFDAEGHFQRRFDAKEAELRPGKWVLTQVLATAADAPAERMASLELPTKLTREQVQDSFSSPETLSVWKLSPFIEMLEDAGFSATRHRLYLHRLLSQPFLLVAMVYLAAVFALHSPRSQSAGLLVSLGIAAGFLVYFLTDIVHALGLSGTLPVWVAAWTPPLTVLLMGAAMLLHQEDG